LRFPDLIPGPLRLDLLVVSITLVLSHDHFRKVRDFSKIVR
jgi:hypothetical protein